ncbi:DUF6841 family protein [Streptomyces sp. NBC_01294]|uniref:DUF6841 family protein n=1 Tax=Streptomyces sp. NBC_01294 TaxID=2903815 RepID=UPI002DD940B0|nr:hypothetical protein [Streptomyces sp. NBC_01294]WRZ61513.1 hypothetical protein OG534_36550 [Streptomyces sp. NBC_01294]
MPHTDLSAVEADVRTWFDQYVATFIGLAAAGRTDPAPLLDYFDAPITMTTDAAHVPVLASDRRARRGTSPSEQTRRDAGWTEAARRSIPKCAP